MTQYDAAPVMRQLKQFQRNTVEHIIRRFFTGDDVTDRFLVADETGLGKTIVARGVVARTIQELQHNDDVDAIDVLYICSNQDLAQQNIRKLAVTQGRSQAVASRLTLLAKHMHRFRGDDENETAKRVNLISFTPGTSFTRGFASGTADERAVLFRLLTEDFDLDDPVRRRRAGRLFQGTCKTVDNFLKNVLYLDWELARRGKGLDAGIQRAFLDRVHDDPGHGASLADRLRAFLDTDEPTVDGWNLVGDLRAVLAEVSAAALTPDLIILDEFQRFRDLLEIESEAGELAHHLFNYRHHGGEHGAKVLLLSATPFKPFTYAEEAAEDDHHKDFLNVIRFLANDESQVHDVAEALQRYRVAVVTGQPSVDVTHDVRSVLLRHMTRTERPRKLVGAMSVEHASTMNVPTDAEMRGYVAMKDLANRVQAPFPIDYWKSAPYFVNFMDTYKVGQKVREALEGPDAAEVERLLHRTRRLDFAAIDDARSIDWGNRRLAVLGDETVDKGWWKLLWMPPCMPYTRPGTPFARSVTEGMTKRVVFSSWSATPTAAAAILSYAADRHSVEGLTAEKRQQDFGSRLAYRLRRGSDEPANMQALALFWPAPSLAVVADPRDHRREAGQLSTSQLTDRVVQLLRDDQPTGDKGRPWQDVFRRPGIVPTDLSERELVEALSGGLAVDEALNPEAHERQTHGLDLHVQQALEVNRQGLKPALSRTRLRRVARYAAYAPGNVAWRALRRLSGSHEAVTEKGLWRAAATIGSAFRALFSRPSTAMLLDTVIKTGAYWERVLSYCANGNLQAVMDEYLHHLHMANGARELDDDSLLELAKTVAEVVAQRPTRYEVADPDTLGRRSLSARFAQRYGGKRDGQESARQPQLREAFNSPFWPFVLTTTSVGQEGVDFHRYSHSVFHWNVPVNPIDFEQREGRVDRHAGHAVRKNVAASCGEEALRSDVDDPWTEAYRLAAPKHPELGDFAPYWCYPGEAKIERRVAMFPLSRDASRLERAKENVALYRLTFGQPRQEDMLTLIAKQYSGADEATLDALRLDLSAPEDFTVWDSPEQPK